MTQHKAPEIVRTSDIVVATVSSDTYGNLLWTDTEGNSYKVSDKRVQYFKDIIVADHAVRLNYAMSSFGKEYIYSAIPAEQLVKAREPVVKSTPPAVGATTMPNKGKIIPNEGKAKTESVQKQVALKTAVDLAVAKVIEVDSIISYATVFDMWLREEFAESESEIIAKYITKYKKGG